MTTHFVFNGTAANNLSLMAFAKPYGAVVCSDMAHVINDESTAPERFLGMRLLPRRAGTARSCPSPSRRSWGGAMASMAPFPWL